MDKTLRPYLAEMIGTFALVFVGALTVCASRLAVRTGQPEPGLVMAGQPEFSLIVGIALAEGFTLAVALAATVPLSGGYLNPAITLMLYVFKRFELGKTLGLIFVQLLGAAMAGGLLRLFLTEDVLTNARLGTPHLNLPALGAAGLTPRALLSGVGIEVVLTFLLTFAIFGTLLDPRAPRLLGRLGRWLSPLWVGLALMALILAGYSWTGAATNPARYFGPMIWEMTVPSLDLRRPYADHLVYWVGPILGALLAGGVYTYLILPQEEEKAPAAGAGPVAGAKKPAGVSSTLFRSKK
jgi:MIP family channel proteins